MVVVKNPRSKAGRNAAISAVVLSVLLVGGGAAYTYFAGPDASQIATQTVPTVDASEALGKPLKPAEDAKESASVQTLTSPVTPGSNSSIIIKTNAGSKCTITIVYGTTPSKDSGLSPKTADEYGNVSWAWTVESTVPLGTWPVTATCIYHTRSAVVRGDLVVQKTIGNGPKVL